MVTSASAKVIAIAFYTDIDAVVLFWKLLWQL